MLAAQLKRPMLSISDIKARQHSVQVLADQPDLIQWITAAGLIGKEEKGTLSSILEWLNVEPVIISKQWLGFTRIGLPVLSIGLLVYYLFTDNYFPLIGGIFINWCIIAMFARYIQQQHVLLSRRAEILQQYAGILMHFSAVDAKNSNELKSLVASTRSAAQAVKRLSQLGSFFDQRLNVLVNFLLNSFLLYDIQIVRLLEKWKTQHKSTFPFWIESVGTIETLVSLATFRFNHERFNFPEPVAGLPRIDGKEVCHPLIPEKERVGNPADFGDPEKLFLITGSNMSGKTTYLRTVGVTLILAQSGAPVCAESFVFTPMRLLTSIRVNDSLQDHTSYFMAELKQLQLIIHELESGSASLVLVDEILRGTNSEDKNYGSEAFIRKLLGYNALCLFATHDLSLGALGNALPSQVKNVCFESTLKEGELIFDYRLREGLAKNRNATFLMQKMGII
jgi:DNA mismatch repair ATPase MutS